jgi:hypothetical protein
MALMAANMSRARAGLELAVLFFAVLLPAQSFPAQSFSVQNQQAPPQSAFDEKLASQMLLQLSEALQGHSQKQFLALFDLEKMKDGALFQQQISSFYSQTESIRVHMNLGEITDEGGSVTVSVNAEMEAEPRNGGPIARQNEMITFTVANAGGWKFVDVQPRSFFSLP